MDVWLEQRKVNDEYTAAFNDANQFLPSYQTTPVLRGATRRTGAKILLKVLAWRWPLTDH